MCSKFRALSFYSSIISFICFTGLKQIRNHNVGLKNYFSATHSGGSMAAIHDHANNIRTVGMGEFVAVLNGVEFRTRHNDYRLYMASNGKSFEFWSFSKRLEKL